MNFQQLKWIAILAPIAILGVLQTLRWLLAPFHASWQSRLLMDTAVVLAAIIFYASLFAIIGRRQQQLEHQNRELVALRSAGIDITSELSLDVVLQKVVDQACSLIGTRYGALAVYDEKSVIRSFITTGLPDHKIARIESPPVGKGLLGAVLREGQHLRVSKIEEDPRSCGFPMGHPEMSSLLAVPLVCQGPFIGNLYLSEKRTGGAFTEDEEETLTRFATQASIAVDNAHLHAQVASLAVAEERLRLAREMHDSQAQVLAYANTKAQAVQALLDSDRIDEAKEQLRQLAEAAREVYADVREGILGLRTVIDTEHNFSTALANHLERWQDQSGIGVDLVADEPPRFASDVELQLLRILQEALANVRKHSEADRVQVRLETQAGQGLRMIVEDDGIGFDPQERASGQLPRFGLVTMRERCEAIGASFQLKSKLNHGTRVEIKYPRRHGGTS